MLYVFLVVQIRLVASVSVVVVVARQSSELPCQYCFPWLIQILYAGEKKLDKLTLLSTDIFIYIIIITIIIIIIIIIIITVFNKKIKLGYIAKTITPCKGKNSQSVTSWLQFVG